MPLLPAKDTIDPNPKDDEVRTQQDSHAITVVKDEESIAPGCGLMFDVKIDPEQLKQTIAKFLPTSYLFTSCLNIIYNTKEPTLLEIANNVQINSEQKAAQNANIFHWSDLPAFKAALETNATNNQELQDVLDILRDIKCEQGTDMDITKEMIQGIIDNNPGVAQIYTACTGQNNLDHQDITL